MIRHLQAILFVAALVFLMLAAFSVPSRRIGYGWLGAACAVLAVALPTFVAV